MAKFALTPAHVIDPFHKVVSAKLPYLIRDIVFDPQLTYETAISVARVQDGLNGDVTPKTENASFPALAWNRGNLRRASTGRVTNIITSPVSGSVTSAKVSPVEFDYTFQYYAKSIADSELFEALWITNEGINSITSVEVSIPGVDSKISFAFNWERDLTDIFFNKETNYYKSIQGQAKVSGVIVTGETNLPEEDYPRIEKVVFNVFDCNGNSIETLDGKLNDTGGIDWTNRRD